MIAELKKDNMIVLIQWVEKRKTKFYKIGWSFLKSDVDIEDALHNTILQTFEKIDTLR